MIPIHPHDAEPTWSHRRVERVRDMWERGKNAAQIAIVLGPQYTRAMVASKLRRMGLTR